MLVWQAAVLAAALGAGETVLLDFYGDHCGPCRQMAPVVQQLAAQGYPVRQVDVSRDPALASRFRVTGIPCFVMLQDGREVDRHVGGTSREHLLAMLGRAGAAPGPRARGQSPPAERSPATFAGSERAAQERTAPPTADETAVAHRVRQSCVRLKVNDPSGHSFGTGTLVHYAQGEGLILTCGHLFRDSEGRGKIEVDLFHTGQSRSVPGCLVAYDLKTDLGLVAVRSEQPLPCAPIAPPGQDVQAGDAVFTFGCNHGQDPSPRFSRIVSIDRYQGPANLVVTGRPVVGRSGGGVFSSQGLLLGVCFAADPAADEGLYVAHRAIHQQLDAAQLAYVYQPTSPPGESRVAAEMPSHLPPANLAGPPAMPKAMPRADSGPEAVAAGGTSRPGEAHATLLDEIARRTDGTEVIVILRPRGQEQPSQIFVLDQTAPEFLEQLAAQRRASQKHLTSHAVPEGSPVRRTVRSWSKDAPPPAASPAARLAPPVNPFP